jgi:RNA polymerase sigma-70 factor (ECF subfamily)
VGVVTTAGHQPLGIFLAHSLGARARSPGAPGLDPDAALIAAAQGGDHAAFNALYHRHLDWIWRRVTWLVGPVPEREDLVQQIFLEVHRAIPGFRGDALFSTFLFRIVANIAYQHLRRARRRPVTFDAAALDELAAPGASPEVALRERQELERAFSLLARLKPKKRIALLLRSVEALSLEEIGVIVGARAPAVAQRVKHAQRELSALIERADQRGRRTP